MLATVIYSLTEDNTVLVRMSATADEATPVNMANHAYYNLAGHGGGPGALNDHVVTIRAPWVTPVNKELIPTGELSPVLGTIYDLTSGRRLGEVLDEVPGPTPENNGFDHNFVISRYGLFFRLIRICNFRDFEDKMRLVSIVEYKAKQRTMKVFSNQPGIQFYTGNFLPRSGMRGKV